MQTKKSTTKRKQVLWFIGLYVASLAAIFLFHEITNLLIKILKD